MKHFKNKQFRTCFSKLPESVKKIANKNFEILKSNINHPSLFFKKVKKYWTVRIGIKYRALAIEKDENIIWFWIGNHAEYEKLIK